MSGAVETIANDNSALPCALTVCCIRRALRRSSQGPQPGQVQDGGAPTPMPRKHGRHLPVLLGLTAGEWYSGTLKRFGKLAEGQEGRGKCTPF